MSEAYLATTGHLTVRVYEGRKVPGTAPSIEITEAEACRRLLAHDELLAALLEARHALEQAGVGSGSGTVLRLIKDAILKGEGRDFPPKAEKGE